MMPSPVTVELDLGPYLPETLAALYELGTKLAAEAEPGDVLYGATPQEMAQAVRNVGAILPQFLWPFVLGEAITVGQPSVAAAGPAVPPH